LTRYLAAGALGVVLFAVLVPAGGSRTDATPSPGVLTHVEYSGTWTHTYKGSPSGSAKNPGSETVISNLTFTESVSLFAPVTALAPGSHGVNSYQSAVKVTLSGQTSITYTGSNLVGCSASFSAHSGLKGDQWLVGGFGLPLAYVSVNEKDTKGVVAVYAEAPGLRSSSHNEFIVRRTGGNAGDNACDSGNMPIGEFPCNDTPLITDPEYTAGDRGFNNPPYGFLHAVAKLDPHTDSYSHPYHVNRVLSSCDGTDTVKADSRLIVTNSHATGIPPSTSPASTTPASGPGKQRAKELAQDDLRSLLPDAAFWCGQASLGVGSVTIGLAGVATAGIAVVGAQLFITDAPMCQALAGAIASDIRIIHDPPLGHVDRLTTGRGAALNQQVATCPHWQGQPPDFCTNLSADLAGLVKSATGLGSVESAIATTIGRESGAVKQHNTAAAKLQDQHLVGLNTQAQAAVRSYRAASARLASLYRSVGLRVTMTEAQDAKTIQALVSRAARAGTNAGTLRQVAGDALAPRALDVLALLAGHLVAPSSPPPSGSPAISKVTFAGTATNPTVVIHGTNLGKLPAPNPSGHPSGLNGCPVVAGDTGYLYGTSLYIVVPSGNWSGGRYRPSVNETDCLDLVVTKFTPTEVDFHFGPFYTSFYPKFALAAGLQVIVVVNGATLTTTVKYG
jgi:hypothetical protein